MFKIDDLFLLAPELSLVLLALVVMTLDLFVRRRDVIAGVSLVGLLIPLGFTLAQDFTGTHRAFFNMLIVDPYAIFFKILFLGIGAVMILTSYDYVGKYVKADGEFYTFLLLSVAGMMLMASSGELITLYISLELTSFPLYIMAGLIRTSERSAEAAVKYVLLGAMSSAILLYGMALLYGLTGTTDLQGIANAVVTGVQQGNIMLMVASILLIAGFGFKISAAPFHMWAPDIYEGSPTPATAFFSVGSKAAGFAALIRVFTFGGLGLGVGAGSLNLTMIVVILSIVAIVSMTYGNIVAAVQENVKRMMAYSGIAQAGYILVGFTASLATGDPSGNAVALFFILVYVITNLGAFAGIIALANLTGGEKVSDFKGLWKRAPLLSVGTALCLLSLAGIPPVAGFWSKVLLFLSAWDLGADWTIIRWLVVIALLNSIVSLVYYGRIVKAMFFDEPAKNDRLVPTWGISTSLIVTTAALLLITIFAQFFLDFANPAANSLLIFLNGK